MAGQQEEKEKNLKPGGQMREVDQDGKNHHNYNILYAKSLYGSSFLYIKEAPLLKKQEDQCAEADYGRQRGVCNQNDPLDLIVMIPARTADYDQHYTVCKENQELQAEIGKVKSRGKIPSDHFSTKTDEHVQCKYQERDSQKDENQRYIFKGCGCGFQGDKYFPDDPCSCYTVNAKYVQENKEVKVVG